MDDRASIIATIYAAAAEEASWSAAVQALQRVLGAASASLFIGSGAGGELEPLHVAPFDAADIRAYVEHYRDIDPWLARLLPSLTGSPRLRAVRGESVLPQEEYRRTEFYNDFGRRIGLEWVVGGVGRLGEAGFFNLGLQRPEGSEPFRPDTVSLLNAVLPHLQRGLQLRERLRGTAASLPLRVLDALPEAALVLDADLVVRHANAAAARLSGPCAGLRIMRDGSRPGAPLVFRLPGVEENVRLAALVQGVALLRRAGGAFRLLPRPEMRRDPVALLVSPLPGALSPNGNGRAGPPGPVPGLALVLLRPLDRPPPPTALLQNLFGLTAAEAEVASGLAGGTRAEQLAERRGVSLATIRAQVRTVLEKTGTVNLRELEALLASLPLPGPVEGAEKGDAGAEKPRPGRPASPA
ncbi:DNA-binding transcriptional regulator, CsgD family [Roseomonas rosea]|uniref:DNA-binding transcriptional regulator, CsgD family n=1 Tax=Muricoccus roseus TaxID=198092 RepID=A0A1M6M2L6_9PROT|nr:helix-turn-helix transcriptional regulator [Roseomonas rosea]SHJ77695.1 DNA-binding transcriptional regulator, CsgD family [Roseomonas rosea]